ncbi:unnamed protein product [Allacma fusca]|uniref:Uncharacterized protein n=1 Tax=Allacma fusca TaxID=39272 RepID=A0A8J2NYD5_9HEXA|nr:unnamed protein product [Allacma fusca]
MKKTRLVTIRKIEGNHCDDLWKTTPGRQWELPLDLEDLFGWAGPFFPASLGLASVCVLFILSGGLNGPFQLCSVVQMESRTGIGSGGSGTPRNAAVVNTRPFKPSQRPDGLMGRARKESPTESGHEKEYWKGIHKEMQFPVYIPFKNLNPWSASPSTLPASSRFLPFFLSASASLSSTCKRETPLSPNSPTGGRLRDLQFPVTHGGREISQLAIVVQRALPSSSPAGTAAQSLFSSARICSTASTGGVTDELVIIIRLKVN